MNQTKICSKCNIEKLTTEFHAHRDSKFGVGGRCKLCRAEYDKQHRQNSKDKISERKKKYAQANKEKIAEYKKQYAQANKEKIAEQRKRHYINNKEVILERNKEWTHNNKECRNEYYKQYYHDNKERKAEWGKQYRQTPKGKAKDKAKNHNRRAQKRNSGGKHTGTEILNLFDLQSGTCPYCNTKLHKTGKNKYHSDHIMPLSRGGTNDISNIQLLCPPCNLSKHDKFPEEFAAKFNKLF